MQSTVGGLVDQMPNQKPMLDYGRPRKRDIFDFALPILFILVMALCLTWLALAIFAS